LKQYLVAAHLPPLTSAQEDGMARAMYCLKDRARTFPEIIEKAEFVLTSRPIEPDEKAAKQLDTVSRGILRLLTPQLQNVSWTRDELEAVTSRFADAHGTKFGKLAGPLRAALAGRAVTPSVFDMMLVLGRDEALARLTDASAEEGQLTPN
jgi:glutamyl-tRNA synthetase